jgi:cysteine desulfurase
MRVYFDNAATTPLDPEVLDVMMPYYQKYFGNPSSTHSHGREAKSAMESARKKIAEMLNTSPANLFFTSGGTEADNISIRGLIDTHELEHVVSTRIEHHAVLHTLEALQKENRIRISYLDLDEKGNIDLDQLEKVLSGQPNSLVSLMHANNEVGNLLDINKVAELCKEYQSYFHSDTVQTVGKYPLDLKALPVQAILGSAHKFHGPKGIGFLYLQNGASLRLMMFGGGQERDIRPGTENVAGIVGMAKALEIAISEHEENKNHIRGLKEKMILQLKQHIPGISFNGNSANLDESLYTVINVELPDSDANEMVLFKLDLNHISASGGSACASGALKGSHVINQIRKKKNSSTIRFSFSKFNTDEEVNYVVKTLSRILNQVSLTSE